MKPWARKQMAEHLVVVSVQGPSPDCKCPLCELIHDGSFTITMTPRLELETLYRLLGDEVPLYLRKDREAPCGEHTIQPAIERCRERLRKQLEFEATLPEKEENESPRGHLFPAPPTSHPSSGGGKRIVRSGNEMS